MSPGRRRFGAAILRELRREGFSNITGDLENEPDFTGANRVDAFFERAASEYVFVAAGRSEGIQANLKYPTDFIRDNLLTSCHIIYFDPEEDFAAQHAAHTERPVRAFVELEGN